MGENEDWLAVEDILTLSLFRMIAHFSENGKILEIVSVILQRYICVFVFSGYKYVIQKDDHTFK